MNRVITGNRGAVTDARTTALSTNTVRKEGNMPTIRVDISVSPENHFPEHSLHPDPSATDFSGWYTWYDIPDDIFERPMSSIENAIPMYPILEKLIKEYKEHYEV